MDAFLKTDDGNVYESDIIWNNKDNVADGIRSSRLRGNHIFLDDSTEQVDAMQSLKDPYVPVKKTSLVAFVTFASLFFGTLKNSTPRGVKTVIVTAQEQLEPWESVTKWTVSVPVNPTYLSKRGNGFATSARMAFLASMPIMGWDVPNVNVILAALMFPPAKTLFVIRIADNVLANLAWKDVDVMRS